METEQKILLIGIGNNCRGDDGLGWRFTELLETIHFDLIDCELRYQLQVEDASLVGDYDVVIFADASYEKFDAGFELRPCIPSSDVQFSTHSQTPEAIVKLTNNLYKKFPKAYVLAICGEVWELRTDLSKQAEENLQAAVSFFVSEFLQVPVAESYTNW